MKKHRYTSTDYFDDVLIKTIQLIVDNKILNKISKLHYLLIYSNSHTLHIKPPIHPEHKPLQQKLNVYIALKQ